MISPVRCRVFLVDDHPIVLNGVIALLATETDFEVVGSASDAQSALSEMAEQKPDLLIVDGSLRGPGGMLLLKNVLELYPDLLVVGLTLHEEGAYVREFIRTGAKGFVLKRSAAQDLIMAIRSVVAGGIYIDPAVLSKVVPGPAGIAGQAAHLSQREEDVVRLVARGYSNKDIARELGIGVKTVETYRSRACEKLELRTRSALVRYAMREGWLSPD